MPRRSSSRTLARDASLIQDLKRHGSQLRPIAIKPVGDKIVRLEGQSAVIEAGHVLLPESARGWPTSSTRSSPSRYGRFDDQVDSFSQFLTWAAKPRMHFHIGA